MQLGCGRVVGLRRLPRFCNKGSPKENEKTNVGGAAGTAGGWLGRSVPCHGSPSPRAYCPFPSRFPCFSSTVSFPSSPHTQARYNSTDVAAKVEIHHRRTKIQREGTSAGTVPLLIPEAGDSSASRPSDGGAGGPRGVGYWERKAGGRGSGGGGGGGTGGGGAEGGRRWRPAPIDSTRGTLDTRLSKAARTIIRGIDLELYKS